MVGLNAGKLKAFVLCIVIASCFLVSCVNNSKIRVENAIGKLANNDFEFYTYKYENGKTIFKITPNGNEIESYINADGFISVDIINTIAGIYTNGDIEDLYEKFGQPIVFYPKNKLAIFDGWSISQSKFSILSVEEEYICNVEKSDFEELLTHSYETNESIFFYSFLMMYEFNASTKEITETDYMYPPSEFMNGESFVDKDDFIMTENKLISVVSFTDSINELEDSRKNIKSVLYTLNRDNLKFNYVEIEEESISAFYFDSNIYLLSFLGENLYMSKYDGSLKLLLKEELAIPQNTAENIFFDISNTTFQNEHKIILSCPLTSTVGDIFVMQFNLEEFSIDFASIAVAPDNYSLIDANFKYE